MKITIKNPDYLGVISGGLCILHCLATPLLFISNAELAGHGTPIEWQLLNFGFIGVYNQERGSIPFERFYLGGDGMQQWAMDGRETIALRGYKNQSLYNC